MRLSNYDNTTIWVLDSLCLVCVLRVSLVDVNLYNINQSGHREHRLDTDQEIILIGVLLRMSAANSFVGAIDELWIVLNTQFELMLPPLISQI